MAGTIRNPRGMRRGRLSRGLAQIHRLQSIAEQLSKITYFATEEVNSYEVNTDQNERKNQMINLHDNLHLCQCKSLLYLYTRLEEGGSLDRIRMREILRVMFEITDEIMLDLAFRAFDKDGDGIVCPLNLTRHMTKFFLYIFFKKFAEYRYGKFL